VRETTYMKRSVLLGVIGIVALLARAQSQDVPLSRFVGDWVGVQRWAIQDPPPNAREPQPVELKIELIEGKLVGTMTPFMGGSDGANFVDGKVVGEELKASGAMGPPRLQSAPGGRGARGAAGWKSAVKLNFSFASGGNNNELTGTVDVLMGDVNWMKYKYTLSRKRSRY